MRRISQILGGVIVLVLAGAIGAGTWFYHAAFSVQRPVQMTEVIVPNGATFDDVAKQLEQQGVIENAFAFRVLGKVRHLETDVRAGEYRFQPRQTADAILTELISGGAQVAEWITIPEGFTAKEIARRLQDNGIGNMQELDAAFAHHEGSLFPSTYLIPIAATPQEVVAIFTDEFRKELPSDADARAKALHMTVAQVVTVASLVEREAKVDEERPLMAGVYYNRLRLKMPLQVDATIEYALPQHKTALSFADLKIDSPYNSYTHAGLPPTPIANPGKASLDAAFHPAKTEYLYYVYKGDGHHAFAKTLAEHQANVAKYEP